MEFLCKDLRQFGVELIPSSAPEYDALLADIRWRVDDPVEGSPPIPDRMRGRIDDEDRETSAILVNRSQLGIAAIQQVWSFRGSDGRTFTGSNGPGANPSILLQYGIPDRTLKLYGYWHVILPGSKRYLSRNGRLLGDNSDVRPPAADEVWTGGGMVGGGGGRGGWRSGGNVENVTLTLDGVFFTDGGFIGQNRGKLWEQVVANAEAHEQLTSIAKEGRDRGDTPWKILADIEAITGPATDRMPMPVPPRSMTGMDEFRKAALQNLAWHIGLSRKNQGDDGALRMILAWGDARLPQFRRLDSIE